MHDSLLRYALTAFVTLLVVVDPFGIVPLFAALTVQMSARERRATLRRAVLVAFGVSVFFLLAGRAALRYLGVTVNAFAISGGILLFATALPMLFGHRAGLQGPEPDEQSAAEADVSVFPLAIPLLSGPATLTTILLLTAQAHGDWGRVLILGGATAVVFGVSWLVLWLGDYLLAHLGQSGSRVATRVLGLVLAALAVQFVLNGITGYYHSLVR